MHLVISNNAAPTLREFASWQFAASGNWAADNERGRGLATRFLELSDHDGFTNILSHIVASIARRGADLTGLEIGFLAELSRRLAAASTDPRPPLTLCGA